MFDQIGIGLESVEECVEEEVYNRFINLFLNLMEQMPKDKKAFAFYKDDRGICIIPGNQTLAGYLSIMIFAVQVPNREWEGVIQNMEQHIGSKTFEVFKEKWEELCNEYQIQDNK